MMQPSLLRRRLRVLHPVLGLAVVLACLAHRGFWGIHAGVMLAVTGCWLGAAWDFVRRGNVVRWRPGTGTVFGMWAGILVAVASELVWPGSDSTWMLPVALLAASVFATTAIVVGVAEHLRGGPK